MYTFQEWGERGNFGIYSIEDIIVPISSHPGKIQRFMVTIKKCIYETPEEGVEPFEKGSEVNVIDNEIIKTDTELVKEIFDYFK